MNLRSLVGLATLLLTFQVGVAAAAPALLPVQGVLTDAQGQRLNGDLQVTFTLYDTPTGGTSFFAETLPVSLEDGLFTVYLGEVNTLDLVNFQMEGTYLGIAVGADAEMTPRLRLATAPYAGFAQFCGEALTLEGEGAMSFAPRTHGHDFDTLDNLPPQFADRVDDDTIPTGGTGINVGPRPGVVVSVDETYVQRRVVQTCPNGGISAIDASGGAICDRDDDTTYRAGTGLSLDAASGNTFSVDEYANLARKDTAAGNQTFGPSNTLYLDYRNARVGIRDAAPTERLEVGGNVKADRFLYSRSETFYRFLGAPSFGRDRPSDATTIRTTSGYWYATDTNSKNFVADLNLPELASLRAVSCYYHDTGSNQFEDFDIVVIRRPLASTVPTTVGSTILDPPNVDHATNQMGVSTVSGLTEVIRNFTNHYYIRVTFDLNTGSGLTGGSLYRFYGCRIQYDMASASQY